MVIGVSGRGGDNLAGVAGEEIAVLCDVDARALQNAAKRFPNAQLCADYRDFLGDAEACKRLDGVVISTPDHTHYPPAMLALQRGLDVDCEKPLTHTVAQARRLAETARANGCVTQMGIQIHANAPYRRTVEAVRGGAVGPVRAVYVFVNGTDWSASKLPAESAPGHLSWDCWLGPRPHRGYSEGYHPASWRRYWEFGGGTTADMACHYMDLAFWALELDVLTALVADGPEAADPECAPRGMRCAYEFAARGQRGPVELHWHAGSDRPTQVLAERGLEKWSNGVLFVGDAGWLVANYDSQIGPAARAAEWQTPPESVPPSPGHHAEWIWCCKERITPTRSFSYGGPLTETVLLANAAFRAARGKQAPAVDAAAMRTGDAAVDQLLDESVRAGFPA